MLNADLLRHFSRFPSVALVLGKFWLKIDGEVISEA